MTTSDCFKLKNVQGDPAESTYYADVYVNKPNFHGHADEIDGYSGNRTDPNGGPEWLVRVFAGSETLDALEADLSGPEKRLPDVPIQALNAMLGQERDKEGWNRAFAVGND